MARAFRQEIDEGIVDRAAALFAQRGFTKTSVQDIAVAVGLSKAGLLHHFSSKDALFAAVEQQALKLVDEVLERVAGLPLGPERDHQAIEALVDVAFARPGLVSLLISSATAGEAPGVDATVDGSFGARAFAAFGIDVTDEPDPLRLIRVIGALSALAVLSIAAHREGRTGQWRSPIVATSFDALGWHRADRASPDSDNLKD